MMDFYEVVDQVIELLRSRGRVTYRALKLQFKLDDETLEALKEEILYSQPQVVDDEGKGLIWTDEAETKPAPTSTQPAQPEVTRHDQPIPAEPPTERRSPEAERRQLTVMFCDLVDSTKLSSQLDPEDYRDVVRAYQKVCSEVIQRYDGHIAQYLGDGLLVYFGYPVAHEEDAQRAIHTGLGIVEAIRTLNTRLASDKGVRLAVRLGIHTGLVVVGEMGGAGRQEQLALGETPNIAARIQGLAAPDTVVISTDTYRLVEGYFNCRGLGEQRLRGVSQPIPVYQVLQESGIQSRLDVAISRGLTPLVGREQEVGLLLERWEQAKDGQGQVILLSGEAGIGKSRLVQVLKDHIAEEAHTRWECRSLPYYQNTALYPLTDFFQQALHWQQDTTPEEKLATLEQTLRQYRLPVAETVPLFAPFLSLTFPEDRYLPLTLSPQQQRQKTLESIVAMVLALVEREPVFFILEDLHWTDPTTLEFLGLLMDQTSTAPLYALLTCRPEFQPSWHHRSYLTEVTINRLSPTQVEQIVHRITEGKTLPTEVLQQIIAKTDGVPLFVEELTKALLESGQLKTVEEHYELTGSFSTFAIPATLQGSLMARLDRLGTAKAVAQYAAAIGRHFSYDLLHAVSPLDEAMLQHELGRLVEAELLYPQGLPPQAIYLFKHALIRDAAYESLLKSTRQHSHQRIAQMLEQRFPETGETQPELLAYHYTEAGLYEQALGYWQTAGQKAIARSAHIEAIEHLTTGLHLLRTLPETPARAQQELGLLTDLGPAVMVTRGLAHPEVEHLYTRAYTLCQQVGAMPQLSFVLWGLLRFYSMRALQPAHDVAERLLALATQRNDPAYRLEAHAGLGLILYLQGALDAAWAHFEQALACYAAEQARSYIARYGIDPGVHALSHRSSVLWYLGYPAQAREQIHQALTIAHALAHPYSLVRAHLSAALLYRVCREVQAVQASTAAALRLCQEHGFALFRAQAEQAHGWVLAMHGQVEAGLAHLSRSLDAWRATGAKVWQVQWLLLCTEVYSTHGQSAAGLQMVSEALRHVDAMGEEWCKAELYRLKGELLLQQSSDNQPEAESCFQQAIAVAQSQHAKSWELRAATSLARLWQAQGKRQDAYDLLAPVYNWFTEGFDTADLKDAKALLNELEG
jgi:predicted ATPase/class 3 adenylate cyclase